jgi:hypothetical protein
VAIDEGRKTSSLIFGKVAKSASLLKSWQQVREAKKKAF